MLRKEIDLEEVRKLRSEGKTVREVAATVGCSTATLRTRLNSKPSAGKARISRNGASPFGEILAELDRRAELIKQARSALKALIAG